MKRSLYARDEVLLRLALKRRRLELGMRQEALARLMGRTRSFVSKYERGESFLLFTEVVRICQMLSLDISQLAGLLVQEEAEPALEAAEEEEFRLSGR